MANKDVGGMGSIGSERKDEERARSMVTVRARVSTSRRERNRNERMTSAKKFLEVPEGPLPL